MATKKKSKRISVTIEVDVPDGMTIGETADWVEKCFPKSAHAECHEQRSLAKKAKPCSECGGTGQTYTVSNGRLLGSSIKPCSRGCPVPSKHMAGAAE